MSPYGNYIEFTHHVKLYCLLCKAVLASYSLSNKFLLTNTGICFGFIIILRLTRCSHILAYLQFNERT